MKKRAGRSFRSGGLSVSRAVRRDKDFRFVVRTGQRCHRRGLPGEALCRLWRDVVWERNFDGTGAFGISGIGANRLLEKRGIRNRVVAAVVAADVNGLQVESSDDAPAGVEGSIPLVARENATKLEVDPSESDSDLTDLAVEDDFAGRLYDAPLSGPDAVYVHRGGAYTTEVRDSDDEIGAIRVNQAATEADERVRLDNPQTGKASLATYLADVAGETSAAVAAVEDSDGDDSDDDTTGSGSGGGGGNTTAGGSENAVRGLRRALEAIAEAAQRAAERADAGDRGQADQSLANVQDRLERAATRLAEASDSLPGEIERASERRLDQSRRRAEQAQAADKL